MEEEEECRAGAECLLREREKKKKKKKKTHIKEEKMRCERETRPPPD